MINIPKNILDELYSNNYEKAIILAKEYIQLHENDYLGWYSLFLAENDYYFDFDNKRINNELAFNKALSLASEDLKCEMENEYNLFNAISVVPFASNMLRVILDGANFYNECHGMYKLLLTSKLTKEVSLNEKKKIYQMLEKTFIIDNYFNENVEEYVYLFIKYLKDILNYDELDKLALEYALKTNDQMLMFSANNDIESLKANITSFNENQINNIKEEIKHIIDNGLTNFYSYAYNASNILCNMNIHKDLFACCKVLGIGCDKSTNDILDLVKEAINTNNSYYGYYVLAQIEKANKYNYLPTNVNNNKDNVLEYLQKAVEIEKNPLAALELVNIFGKFSTEIRNEQGIKYALEIAYNALKNVSHLSNADICYTYANYLMYGYGCEANKEEAMKYYKKAQLLGHPDAFYRMYHETKDSSLLRHAAALGSKDAYYDIGISHYQKKETEDALFWLQKSALKGYGYANFALFRMYVSGFGVTQDIEKAKVLLHNAATYDNKLMIGAADIFLYDDKIKDVEVAAYYYYRAFKGGNDSAGGKLFFTLLMNSKLFGNDEELMYNIAKQSASKHDPVGCAAYGYCLHMGIGCKKDYEDAFNNLYIADYSLDRKDSTLTYPKYFTYELLRLSYAKGLGTDKNQELAKKYKEKVGHVNG